MVKKLATSVVMATICLMLTGVGAQGAAAPDPTMSAQPTSGLLSGQLVTVTGSGYASGQIGGIEECNDAPGQPTVNLDGFAVGVSCNAPSFESGSIFSEPLVNFSPTGTVSTGIVVATGIVGPPSLGTDSAGHNSAADAALYPCPPTSAQQASGDSCKIVLGDGDGNSASVPISFGSPVATSPVATATPSQGLSSGSQVKVAGTGFTPDSPWLAIECNMTPGEPLSLDEFSNLPAGCDQATAVPNTPGVIADSVTSSAGSVSATLGIAEGNIGASPQSASYPCPPTAANLAAGGSCEVILLDAAGDEGEATIGITGPIPTPSISVSPTTSLSGGEQVSITGSAFAASQLAGVLECNDATDQPTVMYSGYPISVSCTSPQLVNTSPTGGVSATFKVVEGVVGPPTTGTDSAGRSATTDAASFPCPPTPAQQAEGFTCQIGVGDEEGDAVREAISFAPILNKPIVGMAATPDGGGYWLVGSDGGVFSFGDAKFYGSEGAKQLNKPIVGMAATPDGGGYWLVGSDGGVFSFGDAKFYGSEGSKPLDRPIVGLAATPDGGGYWLVASDGGVFSFGDAKFYGSEGAKQLNKPIVGMAATSGGGGYWLVASDGGIFSFGDAKFYGSEGAKQLNKPIVGMAATSEGGGYWLVASDGGVFSFGDAKFYGSEGAKQLSKPIVALAPSLAGGGYWLVGSDGGVFSFGGAQFYGSGG